MLAGLPDTDRDEMATQESIDVRCEFCNEQYVFSPQEAFGNTD